eukprot:UN31344
MRMRIAFSIWKDMRSFRIEPTLDTFNELISGCAKSKLPEEALEFYKQLVKHRIEPNLLTIISLIYVLSSCGRLKEAHAFLQMVDKHPVWETNSVMYNNLINGCVNIKDITLAEGYFKQMQKKGDDPDLFTFGSLLNVCRECDAYEKALHYWKELNTK